MVTLAAITSYNTTNLPSSGVLSSRDISVRSATSWMETLFLRMGLGAKLFELSICSDRLRSDASFARSILLALVVLLCSNELLCLTIMSSWPEFDIICACLNGKLSSIVVAM